MMDQALLVQKLRARFGTGSADVEYYAHDIGHVFASGSDLPDPSECRAKSLGNRVAIALEEYDYEDLLAEEVLVFGAVEVLGRAGELTIPKNVYESFAEGLRDRFGDDSPTPGEPEIRARVRSARDSEAGRLLAARILEVLEEVCRA